MDRTTARTQKERALAYLGESRVASYLELQQRGIHGKTLERLVKEGSLVRMGDRGFYALPGAEDDPWVREAALSARVGQRADAFATSGMGGVICLTTAAIAQGLTTDFMGHPTLWIALPYGARAPKPPTGDVRLGVVRWYRPGDELDGIERKEFGGRDLWVTTKARTVVDLFRYRNHRTPDGGRVMRGGLEVEALQNALDDGVDPDAIREHASRLRVGGVIGPYLQMGVRQQR